MNTTQMVENQAHRYRPKEHLVSKAMSSYLARANVKASVSCSVLEPMPSPARTVTLHVAEEPLSLANATLIFCEYNPHYRNAAAPSLIVSVAKATPITYVETVGNATLGTHLTSSQVSRAG